MDDIWTIVGLSSLIASIVTVVLGIARDVLVEKYRFKKQSEAGYIQSQLQVFSRIYFVLARSVKGAVTPLVFKEFQESLKEVNAIMEANTHLIPSQVLNKWLDAMVLLPQAIEEKNPEKQKTLAISIGGKFKETLKFVEEIANSELIPRYRKIVGETVAMLHSD